ncbi:MAG: hypothetical protein WC823_00185 [Parcubacteria group bacterium]|jgi:hypothetical protein
MIYITSIKDGKVLADATERDIGFLEGYFNGEIVEDEELEFIIVTKNTMVADKLIKKLMKK